MTPTPEAPAPLGHYYTPSSEKLTTLSHEARKCISVVGNQVCIEFDTAIGWQNGIAEVFFACPTEQFFDQLLVALDLAPALPHVQ